MGDHLKNLLKNSQHDEIIRVHYSCLNCFGLLVFFWGGEWGSEYHQNDHPGFRKEINTFVKLFIDLNCSRTI